MYCTNCKGYCPAFELTSDHCGDTRYELNDRVKVRNKKSNTWGTVHAYDHKDRTYMIMCDDSEELEWFPEQEVSHKLNHEVQA